MKFISDEKIDEINYVVDKEILIRSTIFILSHPVYDFKQTLFNFLCLRGPKKYLKELTVKSLDKIEEVLSESKANAESIKAVLYIDLGECRLNYLKLEKQFKAFKKIN